MRRPGAGKRAAGSSARGGVPGKCMHALACVMRVCARVCVCVRESVHVCVRARYSGHAQ